LLGNRRLVIKGSIYSADIAPGGRRLKKYSYILNKKLRIYNNPANRLINKILSSSL